MELAEETLHGGAWTPRQPCRTDGGRCDLGWGEAAGMMEGEAGEEEEAAPRTLTHSAELTG